MAIEDCYAFYVYIHTIAKFTKRKKKFKHFIYIVSKILRGSPLFVFPNDL